MLKTILKLPNGTEISSGAGTVNAIKNVTLTECVNDSKELTLGSTCANALEATLITPAGVLGLDAGSEVIVYKEDNGRRRQIGVFILERPTRPTANTLKVTGYDRVSKLDKDLTAWLCELTEWPYTLKSFASMVCEACGLTFKESEVPNGDFLVQQFTKSAVTGRQIMQWLGEICCRFCRATPEGEIEFAWYTDSGKTITPGGELYYFQNSLTYEDYVTTEIDAVQVRMANSESGALWPAVDSNVNSYIITGNAILNTKITENLLPVLANIKEALAGVCYTPCKVSLPASFDIHAGNTVKITDKNGKSFTTYVMTKTQSAQKDTLECTGSHRRDSTTSANNKTSTEKAASAATDAVNAQTAEELFNKLTDNGRIQGIFSENGVWVINAEKAVIKNLIANLITAGILQSKDGGVKIDLDKGEGNLTRGTSAFLSTWDDNTSGWTKNIDEVICTFLTAELKKMRINTVRDFAVGLNTNGKYPEGAKLSLHKIRKGSGALLASIAFDWIDGTRSHMNATASGSSLEGGYTDEVSWTFDDMVWQ